LVKENKPHPWTHGKLSIWKLQQRKLFWKKAFSSFFMSSLDHGREWIKQWEAHRDDTTHTSRNAWKTGQIWKIGSLSCISCWLSDILIIRCYSSSVRSLPRRFSYCS
jgi:hypothetical protein